MKSTTVLLLLLISGVALAQPGPADDLWPLFQEGRFDEVIAQGKALLNTGTETAQVNLAVGRSLARAGQRAEGRIFLERAVEMSTDHNWIYAWAQVELGNCAWEAGEIEAARRAWILARDAGATRNATRKAAGNLVGLGLDETYDTWQEFTTDHFEFHFSDGLANLDMAAYARRHEEAYDAISTFFGRGANGLIRFFVWADQDEATAAGMSDLGFAKPQFGLVHCLVSQTVGHEMTHVVAAHALQPTAFTGLINEGTAVHFDQTGRDQLARARKAMAEARTTAGGPLPPVALAALWEDWTLLPGEVSYPVGGAWVATLIEEGGREKFLEFFTDQSLAHARQVYGDDLVGWMADFDERLAN